ncbi:MAG: hypothetical protein U9M92_02450 [Patescibacteria group bacterium]|nr:hypothetical protein [Patescibacteria group bacterium]
MTIRSITPNRTQRQEKQYKRFVGDAGDRGLVEVDPDKDAIQRLISRGGEFQGHLIAGIRRFSAEQTDYTHAQSILGTDFIIPEEVMEARSGITYAGRHLAFLAETMPSEENLRWCKDNGYAVMPAPPKPIALLPVRALKPANFYLKTGGWYADESEKFASSDKTRRGWLAVRKTLVPNSTSKTWDEQNELLSSVEEVPNAAEMAWFITTYFDVRGIRLFEDIWVRTSSVDSDGNHVDVGHFGQDGLHVGDDWDDGRSGNVGVSSARKFSEP